MTIVKIRSYFFSNKTIKTERTFGQILKARETNNTATSSNGRHSNENA